MKLSSRWRRTLGSLLLAGFCLFSGPGCLGRFALTASVTKFNLETTESQWGREFLFLALYIVPVYPFCAFADLLVVNSIEFWTETNPIDGEKAITLSQGTPATPAQSQRQGSAAQPTVAAAAP
jgi:hypothetical protein